MRVLVAMSGGVDSAVAAGLLSEQGHDVVGVTLHLWDAEGEHKVGRCCAPEDRDDARRVCEHLGVPHYVMDERAAFRANVVEPFLDAYLSGTTPSPCVHCNRTVKLEHLSGLADQLGCDAVATGHYARVERGGSPRLFRGKDQRKDQSYFLFGVSDRTLARLELPLGGLHKDESRAHARRLGLPNANKPDSQELCFVPDGDVRSFAARERGAAASRPGVVRDVDGSVLGHHEGIAGFTIGQRKGVSPGGLPPRYVLRILPEQDEVIVGPDAALFSDALEADQVAWRGTAPSEPFDALVRVRYRHEPAPARIEPTRLGFRARFAEPQRAITRGQAAVVYRGEEVLAGGFIT